MEKPFNGKCHSQFWFVFFATNVLCLLLIDHINYSYFMSNSKIIKNKVLLINNYHVRSKINVISETDSCLGRYIYMHDLPSQFNEDILKNCHLLTRNKTDKLDMCVYIENSGFGPLIKDSSGVLQSKSWFLTNQFLLEVIFHNRMRKYECLTNDSSLASAVYVPFYAGLDIRRYLWGFKTSVRDSSGIKLVKWLSEKPEWKKMYGRDHFLISGRISRDFRRQTDKNGEWGSKFRFLPESENMSMLAIESSSWNNDFAIPYPTYFHPWEESEVFQWQDRMRRQKRRYLFSFAGAPRAKYKGSIRGNIIEQCLASWSSCKLLDCSISNCEEPVNVMKVFEDSVFCLQPPGDSLTRRSIFDSILAGCIPVFFHPGTAYLQYTWHLPNTNHSMYSVFIPGRTLRDREFRINETLLQVSKDEEVAMREEVVRLIPRIIYADPSSSFGFEDAFDFAVKGILQRIETVRRVIREGKDPSIGFADRNDRKFKL